MKISHCHKAKLDALGFCSQCKEPCSHIQSEGAKIETNDNTVVEDFMSQIGLDPNDLPFK